MTTTIVKKSAVDKIYDVLNELNQRIYNNERVVISQLIRKYKANHNLVGALKGRALITPYGDKKYKWSNGVMSQDVPTLKKYASWIHQDVNEYQLKLQKNKKVKVCSTPNDNLFVEANPSPSIGQEQEPLKDDFFEISKETFSALGRIALGCLNFYLNDNIIIYHIKSIELVGDKLIISQDSMGLSKWVEINLESVEKFFFKRTKTSFELYW